MMESGVLVGESVRSLATVAPPEWWKHFGVLATAYSSWSEVSSCACSGAAVACGRNLVHYAGQ